MFISASTECFPDLPPQEVLEILRDLEFTAVELPIKESSSWLKPSQVHADVERSGRLCRDTHRLDIAALDIELAPFDEVGAAMLSFDIPRSSRLNGVEIAELRLPGDAVVALIQRNGSLFVPSPNTSLRIGDHLLIAATVEQRGPVEHRLRAISRAGRLATWYGKNGLLSA